MPSAPAAGFADPVTEAQAVFRAVLTALSRPGSPRSLSIALRPPEPLTPELAAIALTLADPDAPVWLDAPLATSDEVARYLRFHTGAAIVGDPAAATLALVRDAASLPDFGLFAQGSQEYPDRSTTLVVAVEEVVGPGGVVLRGPGVKGAAVVTARPLPPDIADRLARNHALYPRGVDCLLVGGGQVIGIPRSSAVARAA